MPRRGRRAGAGYFLDWELALWGDPGYDLAHEQIKSAIVDTVRYSQAFTPEHVLTVKLNNAYRRWGITDRIDSAVVETRLRDWAEAHREPH